MKYLITESRFNNAIEKFLKAKYDSIVSVFFRKSNVWLASEDYLPTYLYILIYYTH